MVSDYVQYRPDKVYDDGAAYQSYLTYLDGRESSEAVLLALMPLIYSLISRKFKTIQDSHKDDLFSEAASKVWRAIDSKQVPDSLPEVFYTYVIHAINSGFSMALRRLDAPYTRLDVNNMPSVSSRFPTSRQIDAKLFLEELPQLIQKRIGPTFRFAGKAGEACQYILDRILSNKRVVNRVLKLRFGITNTDFYVEYVQVRLRHFLYEIRGVFSDLPIEDGFLDVSRLYTEIPYGTEEKQQRTG